jgi:hypothetical protein
MVGQVHDCLAGLNALQSHTGIGSPGKFVFDYLVKMRFCDFAHAGQVSD